MGWGAWVALIPDATFGLYGIIKKQLDVRPGVPVTVEVLWLAPVAVFILLQTCHKGGAVLGGDLRSLGFLRLCGPLTALPLILCSHAAHRRAMWRRWGCCNTSIPR